MMRFLLLLLCFSGWTWAQSVNHSVHMGIPTILQLRIGDDVGSDLAIPLEIYKTQQGLELKQQSTRLELLANTTWQLQLSIETTPVPFRLSARLNQTELRLTVNPQVLAQGEATRGWKTLTIDYKVDGAALLPDQAKYEVNIHYFLSQP